MKNSLIITAVILLLFGEVSSQTVKGKLVDENQAGLVGIELKLYINPNIYTTTTTTDGSFIFNNVTEVEDEQLPTGYAVSNNFPNPFNPITRINITLPNKSNVKIEVFNILGQNVKDVIDQYFSAGTNFIDIEMNGLPNGIYITRITIDNKYTVVKKMMLVYGSQHLIVNGDVSNTRLNKNNSDRNTFFETTLDSLVATSAIIGKKIFSNLPSLVSDTLDLGNLIIERYCPGEPIISYSGKTYHTVTIGTQCWLKENLDVGVRINGSQNASNNGVIEKYCYNDSDANCNTYGGLYQWNEAMQYVTTSGAQGICPTGWHIPMYAELQTLRDAVGGNSNSLKAIGEGYGSGVGTNISGFSALLAGDRNYIGSFSYLSDYAFFWISTELDTTTAYFMYLYAASSNVDFFTFDGKEGGFSIRCLKD